MIRAESCTTNPGICCTRCTLQPLREIAHVCVSRERAARGALLACLSPRAFAARATTRVFHFNYYGANAVKFDWPTPRRTHPRKAVSWHPPRFRLANAIDNPYVMVSVQSSIIRHEEKNWRLKGPWVFLFRYANTHERERVDRI